MRIAYLSCSLLLLGASIISFGYTLEIVNYWKNRVRVVWESTGGGYLTKRFEIDGYTPSLESPGGIKVKKSLAGWCTKSLTIRDRTTGKKLWGDSWGAGKCQSFRKVITPAGTVEREA